jgi:hypothetical protein
MQNVFLSAMNNSMAGVVTALASDNDIGVGGKDVDDLSLPFIAPLRADQDRIGHDVLGKILSRRAQSRQSGLRPRIRVMADGARPFWARATIKS